MNRRVAIGIGVIALIALTFGSWVLINHVKIKGVEEMNNNENIKKVADMGISSKDSAVSIELLNAILAGEFVLLVQTLNYHWNLVGPEFHDYHLLFDDQYKIIFEKIDAIAERVRSLDGKALGSLDSFIKKSLLKEDLGSIPKPHAMVENLLAQHEALIKQIREAINKTAERNNDMGTSNFLTDLVEKHEKIAWMLRSLLQR